MASSNLMTSRSTEGAETRTSKASTSTRSMSSITMRSDPTASRLQQSTRGSFRSKRPINIGACATALVFERPSEPGPLLRRGNGKGGGRAKPALSRPMSSAIARPAAPQGLDTRFRATRDRGVLPVRRNSPPSSSLHQHKMDRTRNGRVPGPGSPSSVDSTASAYVNTRPHTRVRQRLRRQQRPLAQLPHGASIRGWNGLHQAVHADVQSSGRQRAWMALVTGRQVAARIRGSTRPPGVQPGVLEPSRPVTLPLIDVVHSHSITRLSLPGPRASFLRTSSG